MEGLRPQKQMGHRAGQRVGLTGGWECRDRAGRGEGKHERGHEAQVSEVSLKSVFPPLSLTFLKDYQPAIAQGSPKRIVSVCNYQLGNVFKT